MNFAQRFGLATPLGIRRRMIADTFHPLYKCLYEEFSESGVYARYFHIEGLPGDGTTSRFEIKLAVFGVKVLLVDGFLVAEDGFPNSFDKSMPGLYGRVETFGEAEFSLTEERAKRLLHDLMRGVRTAL